MSRAQSGPSRTMSVIDLSASPEPVGWDVLWAKDAYARDFRVNNKFSNEDGSTGYVVTRHGHVTDVVIIQGDKSVVTGFTTGSWFDNHTPMDGFLSDDSRIPQRYVENAAFFLGKVVAYLAAVQQIDDKNPEEVTYLASTYTVVGDHMKKYLEKKPELKKDDDPLVKVICEWPTEALDATTSVADLKKAWLLQHRKLFDCMYTDPKLAKELGRSLKLRPETMELFFGDGSDYLSNLISWSRASFLLRDPHALLFSIAAGLNEEFSYYDEKYATKVPKYVMQGVQDIKCLDMFLDPTMHNEQNYVITRLNNLLTDKEQTPKILGKANLDAILLAKKTLEGGSCDAPFHLDTGICLKSAAKIISLGWPALMNQKYSDLGLQKV